VHGFFGRRYEAALHTYNQYLRQQHYTQLRIATMHPTSLHRSGSGSTGGGSSGGSGPASSPPHPAVLAAAVLAALQPFVAERCADCYTAVADWNGLQTFVSNQQRRAGAAGAGSQQAAAAGGPSTEPSATSYGAGWWARFAAGPHMHQVYALASFDMSGVVGHEVPEGSPGAHTPQHALLRALHAITLAASSSPSSSAQSAPSGPVGYPHRHSEHHPEHAGSGRGQGRGGRRGGGRGGGGGGTSGPQSAPPPPSPEQPAIQQAQDTLASVWPTLAEVYSAGSATRFIPAHAQPLVHTMALSLCHKALELTGTPAAAPLTDAQQKLLSFLPGPSCSIATLLWPHITLGSSISSCHPATATLRPELLLPQLHIGLLALPASVYAPATHPLLARPTLLSPAVLTQLLRVQAALDLMSKSHYASSASTGGSRSLTAGTVSFALTQGLAPHAPGTPSPTTPVLLLALALSARASGNNDLTLRTLERLASLPAISTSHDLHQLSHLQHQAATSSSLASRQSYPLPGSPKVLSAVLGAARAGVMAEVGLLSLQDSAEAQVACLQPFLVPPIHLLGVVEGGTSGGPYGSSRHTLPTTLYGSPHEVGSAGAHLPHSLSSSPSASPHAGGALVMTVRAQSHGLATAVGSGTAASQGSGIWSSASCDNLAAAFLGLASWATKAQATAALKRAAMSGGAPGVGGAIPSGGGAGGSVATSPAIPIPPPPPPPRPAAPSAWGAHHSQQEQHPPQHVAQGQSGHMPVGAVAPPYHQLGGLDWAALLGHYVAHYQDTASSGEGNSPGAVGSTGRGVPPAPARNAWEHGAPGTAAGPPVSTSPPVTPVSTSLSHSPSHSNTGRLVTLTRSHQPTSPGTSQELVPVPPAPHPLIPVAACERHAPEAGSYLAALTLSPRMSRAWLHWGLALLSWSKELKVTPGASQSTPAGAGRTPQSTAHGVGSPPAGPGAWGKATAPSQPALPPSFATAAATHSGRRGFVASTSGVVVRGSARGGDRAGLAQAAAASPSELEAVGGGAHALCAYLQLAASQGELSEPEDAVPALLRVLQVGRPGQAVAGISCLVPEPLDQHSCLAKPGLLWLM
jgi:hypothetical protein